MNLDRVIQLFTHYRYAVLFPITIMEGPIVTIIAAFLASLGYFNIFLVYGIVILGDLIGDGIFYAIGRYGGKKFIEKWGHYLRISPENISHLEKHFEKHGGKTLLFGKWTQSVGAPILVAGGMAKVPFGKFMWFNVLGTLPKSLVLVFIGYYFGEAYRQIDKYFSYAMLSMFFAIILIVAIYFFVKKFRKNAI